MNFTTSPLIWARSPLYNRSFGEQRPLTRKYDDETDILFVIAAAIGIAIIGIFFSRFIRVQRGLLGIILAITAVMLLIYWLRELLVSDRPKWLYDILEDENEITLIAEVPGPEDQVDVKLEGRRVDIRGGRNFRQTVKLKEKVETYEKIYVNGVLNVRFRRLKV